MWTKEEVRAAPKGRFEEAALPELVVRLLSEMIRENRVAHIEAPASAAAVLDKMDHLRLGWVNCRIRPRTEAERCYRCLGFGHITHQCGGLDRTRACFRCGKNGHVARSCLQKKASCYLCENVSPSPDTSHITRSAKCGALRVAVRIAPKKRR
ncbi:zinc finger protein GIS2-like [Copidosoma floridanum]|uniref:zinc finger protein GIS2-like n=1 Tax=Copidosoma floridanum TaxID=29053 RepID=UPI0006C95683|nr:zinc finger protein GIS2-like [Copidosoma floridanum]